MFNWAKFFREAAVMTIDDGRIKVEQTNAEVGALTEVVYVWLAPDGTPIRIGTCKRSAIGRIEGYSRYINDSLTGSKSATPLLEAKKWVATLHRYKILRAVVHQPKPVLTAVGLLRPYLDVERFMIRAIKDKEMLLPPDERFLLNRSHR